jgi:hypothetical protein
MKLKHSTDCVCSQCRLDQEAFEIHDSSCQCSQCDRHRRRVETPAAVPEQVHYGYVPACRAVTPGQDGAFRVTHTRPNVTCPVCLRLLETMPVTE